MLYIMVLLKYLGSYGNEATLQKIGCAMGISKGAVSECVMQACSAILKPQKKVIRWPNSDVYLSKDKYFNKIKEYLFGDSAFSASSVMLPAFKKGHNSNLSEERRYFNTKVVKVQIKSEHCLGLLKAQFQCSQGH